MHIRHNDPPCVKVKPEQILRKIMLINSSTKVTFPGSSEKEISKILFVADLPSDPNKFFIITEVTPFHPLDYNWSDQPADRGFFEIDTDRLLVEDCLTAAFDPKNNEMLLGLDIKTRKIRKDDTNWFFLVAHIFSKDKLHTPISDLVGKEAKLEVDHDFRLAISKSHTASHLAALALNLVTSHFWKKLTNRLDSLGNPDLDKETIMKGEITQDCSTDYYHCGKSLRKNGFDVLAFFNETEFKQIEADINKQLLEWCSNTDGLKIIVKPKEAYLHEKRECICYLPKNKIASIPCGGTHIDKIHPTETISVILRKENESDFAMVSKLS